MRGGREIGKERWSERGRVILRIRGRASYGERKRGKEGGRAGRWEEEISDRREGVRNRRERG